MADRAVRQGHRKPARPSSPAGMVRADAPRGAGSLFPRSGLGDAEGFSGEADRPRPVPAKRLSRHAAGLRERLPDGLVGLGSLQGRPGVHELQCHRTFLDLSSALPCGRPDPPGTLAREVRPLERRPDRRGAAEPAQDQPVRRLVGCQGDHRAHRGASPLRPFPAPQHRPSEAAPRRRTAIPGRRAAPALELHPAARSGLLRSAGRTEQIGGRDRRRSDNPRGAGRPASRRGASARRPGIAHGRVRPRRRRCRTLARPLPASPPSGARPDVRSPAAECRRWSIWPMPSRPSS